MNQITIDCTQISSLREIHATLARELDFPDWYGANLDALHDCLTALSQDTHLTFLHFSCLPFPTAGLLRVLRDSEMENPNLEITLISN